jgi:ABC-type glycerol-3-phosphate transport system substrate-binding protein
MALYAAAFNTSQNRYRINVTYAENVAESLAATEAKPALAIGRNLKNSQSRSSFQALDQLFSELVINQSSFYPGLLELGNVDGRQLLLPVSFNLSLIVFDKKLEPSIQDGFVIDIAELEKKGAELNKEGKASLTNMGFGPRWSPEFLYSTMELLGAGFKEGAPLKWNHAGLEAGIAYIRAWSERANGSAAKEDEFQFKYLYLPDYKSVEVGRIGYAAMKSSEFFIVSGERRSTLSFRWLSKDGAVPVEEDVVYAGICRKGPGGQAAESFLKWFYSEETQSSILDEARRYRSMESSFGIAGGFSSIRSVNEKLFPLYYPSLLGKMPPAPYLKSPNVLPALWPEMKRTIVLPFLLEATGPNPPPDPNEALEARLQDWLKRRSTN